MNDHARMPLLAEVARAAYGRAPLADAAGLIPDTRLFSQREGLAPHRFVEGGAGAIRDATGFAMRAYRNEADAEYLLAFAGTDGVADWVQNTRLGAGQYADSAPLIFDYIDDIVRESPAATIHLVGHSLGGALAQYTAYDLAADRFEGGPYEDVTIRLTTFNALGVLDELADPRRAGLNGFHPGYAERIDAAHYVTDGDFVPRLGGGHFAGEVHVLSNLTSVDRQPFGLTDGHGLDRFVQLAQTRPNVSEVIDPALVVTPLDIAGLQRNAGAIALIANELADNGNETGTLESVTRLVTMAGAILALGQGAKLEAAGYPVPIAVSAFPEQELFRLVDAVLDATARQLDADEQTLTGGRLLHSALASLRDIDAADTFADRLAGEALMRSGLAVAGAGLITTLIEEALLDIGLPAVYRSELLPGSVRGAIDSVLETTSSVGELLTAAGSTAAEFVDALLGRAPARVAFSESFYRVDAGGEVELTLELSNPAGAKGRVVDVRVSASERLMLAGPVIDADGPGDGRFLVRFEPGTERATFIVRAAPAAEAPTLVAFTVGGAGTLSEDPALNDTLSTSAVLRIAPPPGEPGGRLIVGTAGDDADGLAGATGPALIGTGAADTILGLAGDDDLVGGGGADDLDGGPGRDIVSGGPGNDRLTGTERDIFLAGSGHDLIQGSGLLAGGSGEDLVEGTDTPDVLAGGAGDDVLRGGAGDDLITADGDLRATTRDFRVAFVTAAEASGSRRVSTEGVEGVFVPTTMSGDDAVYAGGGADLVFGGPGDDRLFGEAGRDELEGNAGDDALFGGADDDVLFGDTNLNPDVAGRDLLRGGEGDDRLAGGPSRDHLYGDGGSDVLFGDMDARHPAIGAADWLYGGDGDDVIEAGPGGDVIDAGPGDDLVIGDHPQAAAGYQGSDHILGGDGDDRLYGAGAGDVIAGGSGDDVMAGDLGDGVRVLPIADLDGTPLHLPPALHGDDVLTGGDGNDLILGDGGDDSLSGGPGDDALLGGPGNDRLLGGSGDDALSGGDGHDLLRGAAGDDTIEPGPGNDIVRYAIGDGHDVLRGDRDGPGFDLLFVAGIDDPGAITVTGTGARPTWRFSDRDALSFEGSAPFDLALLGHGHVLAPGDIRVPDRAAQVVRPAPEAREIATGEDPVALDLRAARGVSISGGLESDWYIVGQDADVRIAGGGGTDRLLLADVPSPAALSGVLDPDGSARFALPSGQVTIEDWTTGSISTFVFSEAGALGRAALEAVLNRPPEVLHPFLREAAFGSGAFSIALPRAIDDPDADGTLAFSASLPGGRALPPWLSFDPRTLTLSGRAPAVAGDAPVRVPFKLVGTDAGGLEASSRIELVLVPAGWADPALAPGPAGRGVRIAGGSAFGGDRHAAAAGDVDADGHGDLLLTEPGEATRLLFGHAGAFEDGLDARSGTLPWTQPLRSVFASAPPAEPPDFDADGHPDLVGIREDAGVPVATVLFGGPAFDPGALPAAGSPASARLHLPGDLDGDGRDDLIHRGAVVAGRTLATAKAEGSTTFPLTLDAEILPTGDVAPLAAGDFNGDGHTDFMEDGGLTLGGPDGLPSVGMNRRHVAFDGLFTTAAPAGDLNGDGLTDLAFGDAEANRVRVVYGRELDSADRLDIDADPLGFTISLETLADAPRYLAAGFGADVAGLGDVNGDGIDDLGIGSAAYLYDDANAHAAVVFGMAARADTRVDEADISAGAGWWLPAPGIGGLPAITSVRSAGDIDGDGIGDLIVGSGRYPNDVSLYPGMLSAAVAVDRGFEHIGAAAGAQTHFGSDHRTIAAGGAGDDFLSGGGGDDRLAGDAGDDIIIGGAGDDLIFGGSGDDHLRPGAGRDIVLDSSGDEDYVLEPPAGHSRVLDFAGEDSLTIGGAGVDPEDLTFTRERGDLLVEVSDGRALTFKHFFANARFRIERIALEDGRMLEAARIETYLANLAATAAGTQDLAQTAALDGLGEPDLSWTLPMT